MAAYFPMINTGQDGSHDYLLKITGIIASLGSIVTMIAIARYYLDHPSVSRGPAWIFAWIGLGISILAFIYMCYAFYKFNDADFGMISGVAYGMVTFYAYSAWLVYYKMNGATNPAPSWYNPFLVGNTCVAASCLTLAVIRLLNFA